jgi:hypothetical protein
MKEVKSLKGIGVDSCGYRCEVDAALLRSCFAKNGVISLGSVDFDAEIIAAMF